jgi:hypothetical protein
MLMPGAARAQQNLRLYLLMMSATEYHPGKNPLSGLEELAAFWENSRTGPDEKFEFQNEIIAVEGRTAVARITVTYEQEEPDRWRDLWVLRFDEQDLCHSFKEWPFSPDQDDGHNI